MCVKSKLGGRLPGHVGPFHPFAAVQALFEIKVGQNRMKRCARVGVGGRTRARDCALCVRVSLRVCLRVGVCLTRDRVV